MSKRKRKQYVPPISWDRLDAMCIAIHQQTYEGEQINKALLAEILDAIMRLRAIYQKDLHKSFPPRRTTQADLLNAAVASHLVKVHEITAKQAMEAATGMPCRVDAKAVARTLKNRCRQLQNMGDAVVKYPEVTILVDAATARLRDKGVI